MRERDFCSVSDQGCKNPAGYQVGGLGGAVVASEHPRTRFECAECGYVVCRACRTGKTCHSCQEPESTEDPA